MATANKHRDRSLANLNAKLEKDAVHGTQCINPDHEQKSGKVVADQTGELIPNGWLCTFCARHDLERTNPRPVKD